MNRKFKGEKWPIIASSPCREPLKDQIRWKMYIFTKYLTKFSLTVYLKCFKVVAAAYDALRTLNASKNVPLEKETFQKNL